MSTSRIEQRLRKAKGRLRYVRVHRRRGWDSLSGYVVDIGTKWVLLTNTDNSMCPGGFMALRLRDIVRVRHLRGSETFQRSYLERHGQWPPLAPRADVALDRTGNLVKSLAAAFPLLALHTEREDPHVCFIGRPIGYRGKSVGLQEISPNAVWDERATRYWFDELTRIDVGDGYCVALREVGGKPPKIRPCGRGKR